MDHGRFSPRQIPADGHPSQCNRPLQITCRFANGASGINTRTIDNAASDMYIKSPIAGVGTARSPGMPSPHAAASFATALQSLDPRVHGISAFWTYLTVRNSEMKHPASERTNIARLAEDTSHQRFRQHYTRRVLGVGCRV